MKLGWVGDINHGHAWDRSQFVHGVEVGFEHAGEVNDSTDVEVPEPMGVDNAFG